MVVFVSAAGWAAPTAIGAQGSEIRPDTGDVVPPVTIPRSQRLTMNSRLLGRIYDLHVKLPPNYDSLQDVVTRYPVLYLNDATYNFQVAAGITHVPMNSKTIEDVILVGIGYSHESTAEESRIRDYTPTRDATWKKRTGGSPAYLEFLESEIIPFVEGKFRVDSKRRAYAGHSLGGLFGAFVLLNRPDLFCCYILSSPSLWYDGHVIWRFEESYSEKHEDMPASVYIAIGSLEHPRRPGGSPHEMVQDVRNFERRLRQRKYPNLRIRSSVVDGGTHETVFPTALMNGLLWHFAKNREIPFGY
jgi:predicted alpha/beta superfamily hydrolase